VASQFLLIKSMTEGHGQGRSRLSQGDQAHPQVAGRDDVEQFAQAAR
jgi:hypothetical protein